MKKLISIFILLIILLISLLILLSEKSNLNLESTEILIYIPPYQLKECKEHRPGYPTPSFLPIVQNRSAKLINNTLIIYETTFNQVPWNYYCDARLPFEWLVEDITKIRADTGKEILKPSRIIVQPEYRNNTAFEPMYGIRTEIWFNLSREMELNQTRLIRVVSTLKTKTENPEWHINVIRLADYYKMESPIVASLDFEPKQLTTNMYREIFFMWSPDGKRIVYNSQLYGDSEIWLMNSDGKNKIFLGIGNSPVFVPDGKKILFICSNNKTSWDFCAMESDGKNKTRLTSDGNEKWLPSFSPEGTKIVFDSWTGNGYNIFTMNSDGTNTKQLTFDARSDYPSYNPDGNKIAYLNSIGRSICIMDSDGENKKQIVQLGNSASKPVWSPDGRKIAFSSNISGNDDIWIIDSNGENLRQLADSNEVDFNPAFSPDGKKLAYVSGKISEFNIWMMDSDGSNKTQLTYGNNDWLPSWSPDGKRIAFITNSSGNWDIWTIEAEKGAIRWI